MSKTAKVLTNTTYPYLQIYVPELKEHRRFSAGKLVLDPADPAFDFLVGWAQGNPLVSIREATGEGRGGAQLKSAAHESLVCDACNPAQTFDSADERTAHVAALHANADETEAPAAPRKPTVQRGTVTTNRPKGKGKKK